MSVLVSSKTKGLIKNLDTGEILNFQFNPTEFTYTRGVNYSEIIAPGQQYPITQFVSGQAREFNLELFLYDHQPGNPPVSGGYIISVMQFVGKLLTPETNVESYKKPPEFILSYGYFTRKCVLTNLDIQITTMDENGNPIDAKFILAIRQVATS